MLKARSQIITQYGEPAITNELYNKQINHYKHEYEDIRQLSAEVNEIIRQVLVGVNKDVIVVLPVPQLENEYLYYNIVVKTLAVYRWHAYNYVQDLLKSDRIRPTHHDIETIKARLSLKDYYKKVFDMYLTKDAL